MDDTFSEDLRLASDDTLLRIGRNLLIYQRIETNLKWLEANGRPIVIGKNTTEASLAGQVQANHHDVKRNTLGQAFARAFRIGEAQAQADESAHEEVRLIFSSAIELEDSAHSREWLDQWHATLVGARNRLAHGFFDAFNLETAESCTATCAQLDEEHDTALSFLHFTRSAVAARLQGTSMMGELLGSDAFSQHLAHMMALESFAHFLEQEARRLRRADGWCLFATAVRTVRASQPDTIAQLLSPGNYKTIRSAAEATQAFQWREEPTLKGSRLLFRWRTE